MLKPMIKGVFFFLQVDVITWFGIDVTVQNHCLFTFSSVICPLCSDVMVLGLMILVAQMLLCRIIVGLLSVLGWIVITHPIGVAGYISQYFCLMWDCSL